MGISRQQHLHPIRILCALHLSFSTVMPAVFETAELVRTFPGSSGSLWTPIAARHASVRVVARRPGHAWFDAALARILLSVCLVSICSSWSRSTAARPRALPGVFARRRCGVRSSCSGALVCGFFWEMWNYYSYPEWIYHTPGAQFLARLEMPRLGYAVTSFALELYACETSYGRRPAVTHLTNVMAIVGCRSLRRRLLSAGGAKPTEF